METQLALALALVSRRYGALADGLNETSNDFVGKALKFIGDGFVSCYQLFTYLSDAYLSGPVAFIAGTFAGSGWAFREKPHYGKRVGGVACEFFGEFAYGVKFLGHFVVAGCTVVGQCGQVLQGLNDLVHCKGSGFGSGGESLFNKVPIFVKS